MPTTAVATLQTAWDCKWSRPGYRLIGVSEHDQPESLWVCVRTGKRVPLGESACEACPHWEAEQQRHN
jgi:hypothetical protein